MSRNSQQNVSSISYAQSRSRPVQNTSSFRSNASDSKAKRKFDEEQEQKFIVRTVPDVLELGNVSNCEFYTVGVPWAVFCVIMIIFGTDAHGSCPTYLPQWMWISGIVFTCCHVFLMIFACFDGRNDKVVCAVIAIEIFALALIGTLPFAFVGLSYVLQPESQTCKAPVVALSWVAIGLCGLIWLDLLRRGINLCCGCSCKYKSICRESTCFDCCDNDYTEEDFD